MNLRDRPETRRRFGLLALVLLVIVPLGMGPDDQPEKLKLGGTTYDAIEERDGSDALVRQVVLGPDGPLWQILADGSSQYMHEDPRGNVVMLTEGTGTAGASPGDVHERVTYDPFGKPTFQDASNQDRAGRTGEFADESEFDNDLLFGGLLYDPETGSRGSSLNADFGGFYAGGGLCYNADEGRHVTRSTPAGNRYGLAGHAPVNTPASPVRKLPGRLKWENITLKRGSASGHEIAHHLGLMPDAADYDPALWIAVEAGADPARLHGIAIPQLMDAVERSPHRYNPYLTLDYVEAQPPSNTGAHPWPSVYIIESRSIYGPEDPAYARSPILGLRPAAADYDPALWIVIEAGADPGMLHSGVGSQTVSCVCVWMPYPCGNNVCEELVCGGECSGGGGGGGGGHQTHMNLFSAMF